MNKAKPAPKVSKPAVTLLIIACIIALVGVAILISSKSQQSDPTMTAAPPPSPGAVKLYPPPGKAAMLVKEGNEMKAKMGGMLPPAAMAKPSP